MKDSFLLLTYDAPLFLKRIKIMVEKMNGKILINFEDKSILGVTTKKDLRKHFEAIKETFEKNYK
jgi:hypothetical protein